MTITAQSVARRLVTTLHDASSERWSLNEVVRAINDAQRQFLIDRPDLLAVTTSLQLAAGTKQVLPAGAARLLAVNRNDSTYKTAVRAANRDILDAQIPGWHSYTSSAEVKHYVFDAREPTTFHVFPPATTAAYLEVVYAAQPALIAEPAAGAVLPSDPLADATPAVITGNLAVPDEFATAVADFALYRLFLKDAEIGDAQRAMGHYAAYAGVLGIDVKTRIAAGPNTNSPFNPRRPATTQLG